MKSGFLALLLFSAISASAEVSSVNTQLDQCLEICMAEMEPGWPTRKCVADCVSRFGDKKKVVDQMLEFLSAPAAKCETYEDDCDRGGDPWGGL